MEDIAIFGGYLLYLEDIAIFGDLPIWSLDYVALASWLMSWRTLLHLEVCSTHGGLLYMEVILGG